MCVELANEVANRNSNAGTIVNGKSTKPQASTQLSSQDQPSLPKILHARTADAASKPAYL
jgi:hypothetical protein